jgi:microcystin degradation protein MlrC
MVVDPEAARFAIAAGVGSEVSLLLGHKLDPQWGTSLQITGRVAHISDGRFQYTGGILGGTWASMGPSAVLETGRIRILISSYPTYDWADEQYRSMGLVPAEAKFVGVKNMMNFRVAYRDVMKAFYVLDLRGPTPPDMRMLPFRRINRPVFPIDGEFDRPMISVCSSVLA